MCTSIFLEGTRLFADAPPTLRSTMPQQPALGSLLGWGAATGTRVRHGTITGSSRSGRHKSHSYTFSQNTASEEPAGDYSLLFFIKWKALYPCISPLLYKLSQPQALPYTAQPPLQHSCQAQSHALRLWLALPDATILLWFTEVCFNIYREKEKVQHDQETQTDLVPILAPAPVMWTWAFDPCQDSVSLSVKWRKWYPLMVGECKLCAKSGILNYSMILFIFH